MEEAVRLDPLSPIMNHHLGNIYQFAERYDDAIKQADKLLEMDPQMRISIELKAWATGLRGDWQEALKLFEEVHRLTNHPLKGLMGLGMLTECWATLIRQWNVLRNLNNVRSKNQILSSTLTW